MCYYSDRLWKCTSVNGKESKWRKVESLERNIVTYLQRNSYFVAQMYNISTIAAFFWQQIICRIKCLATYMGTGLWDQWCRLERCRKPVTCSCLTVNNSWQWHEQNFIRTLLEIYTALWFVTPHKYSEWGRYAYGVIMRMVGWSIGQLLLVV